MTYSLSAFTPVLDGSAPLGNITSFAEEWKRSIAFLGDSWMGTFISEGPISRMEDWFYNGLSRHIEEKTGGYLTWSGYVWEMDLIIPPILPGGHSRRLRRSFDNYFNKVKVIYTDPSDDSTGETAWVNETYGQAKYGIKQEILYADATASEALKIANDFLVDSSYTTPTVVGIEQGIDRPKLEVTVVGYATTGQYKFVTTDNGNLNDIGVWIDQILSTDIGEFLTKGKVAPNTRQVYRYLSTERRSWELLEDLVSLRGAGDEHYRIIITPDRYIHYEIWDRETPIGSFRNGQFHTISGENRENSPRRLEPGIYRDLSTGVSLYPTVSDIGTALTGHTDFLLEEIEINHEDLMIPRLSVYDEEESLRTFVFNKEDLPDEYQ